MADEEVNKYKLHLADARSSAENAVRTWGEDGNPGNYVIRDVLAGWDCDAGDNLVEQVRLKAATIQPKFADALKLLTNLHTPQPDRVDEGDPRGNAYRR